MQVLLKTFAMEADTLGRWHLEVAKQLKRLKVAQHLIKTRVSLIKGGFANCILSRHCYGIAMSMLSFASTELCAGPQSSGGDIEANRV